MKFALVSHDCTPIAGDVIIALGLALLACGLLFVRASARSRSRGHHARAPFALPAAEELARAVRRRALVTVMLLAAATGFALHHTAFAEYAAGASPLAILLVIEAVTQFLDAGRVLRLLRRDGATAGVRFDEIAVIVGRQREAVRASPRLVDRARHHALPRATL